MVFSRMDSRRLPGKALRHLAGRPLLGRVIDRVSRAKTPHRIVVATSDRSIDDPIADFALDEGVEVFRGDTNDVAGRALACAEYYNCCEFVRISGDSPFIDPLLIDQALSLHHGGDVDLVTNLHPRSFPQGCSVEVIATSSLRQVLAHSHCEADREHVTPGFYRQPESFRIANLLAQPNQNPGLSLAVDTPEDLERLNWLARQLGPQAAEASLAAIAQIALTWPGRSVSKIESRVVSQ